MIVSTLQTTTEWLRNLSKILQQVNVRARIKTQGVWLQKLHSSSLCYATAKDLGYKKGLLILIDRSGKMVKKRKIEINFSWLMSLVFGMF